MYKPVQPVYQVNNDYITITNPRICSFYKTNSHYSVETVNLMIIDFLENIENDKSGIESSPKSRLMTSSHFQINELYSAMNTLKTSISYYRKFILGKWIQYKREYIENFKFIVEHREDDFQSSLQKNNMDLIQQIKTLTRECISSKTAETASVSDKITLSIKQFQQILQSNILSIIGKLTEDRTVENVNHVSTIFLENFENNFAHLLQAIQLQITEIIQSREKDVANTTSDIESTDNLSFQTSYNRILYELHDSIHIFNEAVKPISEEDYANIQTIISKHYSTAAISKETDSSLILNREGKNAVFIQHYSMKDRNIRSDEIKTFIRNVEEHNCCGILISQHSGITAKPHLYIEIHNHQIVIYIHNMGNSIEKIQTAIDIIDTLYSKIQEYNIHGDKLSIPKETLNEVNREYQVFICQKDSIITLLKETNKKLLSLVDDIKFPSLDKYLATRYSSTKKQGFICDLCNTFSVNTLKGLAAHKRGCQRKLAGGCVLNIQPSLTKDITCCSDKFIENEII